MRNANIPVQSNLNTFIEQINQNQTVLRIKFFGGHMYGQVRYFVPDWNSQNILPQENNIDLLYENKRNNNNIIGEIQDILPYRFFTIGRK